jgi:pyridinium-3,5-biscarboxylic acid mononucleotide sulfurtransferase
MAGLGDLRACVSAMDRVVVAFSGGADSAFLAWVATDTLGPERVHCVTAVSGSLAPEERTDAARLAEEWGLSWQEVGTFELEDPRYAANGADRCYRCKAELMSVLGPIAMSMDGTVVLGVNVDDLGDHRPGQRAAVEAGARFPLVEAGLGKVEVRELSHQLGLRTWDKPAAACLASRLPYGTPVTVGVLDQVARAETGLRRLGFLRLRVRHYGELARIEIGLDELDRAVSLRQPVVDAVRSAGYDYVTLDLEGLRSGNLNRALAGASSEVAASPKAAVSGRPPPGPERAALRVRAAAEVKAQEGRCESGG